MEDMHIFRILIKRKATMASKVFRGIFSIKYDHQEVVSIVAEHKQTLRNAQDYQKRMLLGWESLTHSLYFPDLGQTYYNLFSGLRKWLQAQKLH